MDFIRLPKPIDIVESRLFNLVQCGWTLRMSTASRIVPCRSKFQIYWSLGFLSSWNAESLISTHKGISLIWPEPYLTCVTVTYFRLLPTLATIRGKYCLRNPSAQSHLKHAQGMSRYLSWDSTVPAMVPHDPTVYLEYFGWYGISATWTHIHILCLPHISFGLISIMRHSGQECWLHKYIVKWPLSDLQRTGTIVAPTGGWICISHQ